MESKFSTCRLYDSLTQGSLHDDSLLPAEQGIGALAACAAALTSESET